MKSCNTDLENITQQPTSTNSRENIRQCYNTIDNVRAIGEYLSGNAMIGLI